MKKCWIISDKDLKKIKFALEEAVREIDDNCASTGCTCDLQGQCLCSRIQRDALNTIAKQKRMVLLKSGGN